MAEPRILVLAGTTAAASPASLLAAACLRELAFLDAAATLISLADYALPLHDADAPPERPPANATRLRALVRAHDAAFVAVPAVGGSVSALVRNALEWLDDGPESRYRAGRPLVVAVGAAATEPADARTALAHLASLLADGLGARVIGQGIAVGEAETAFDALGRLREPRQGAALQALVRQLLEHSYRP